jgi:hypothetical protein
VIAPQLIYCVFDEFYVWTRACDGCVLIRQIWNQTATTSSNRVVQVLVERGQMIEPHLQEEVLWVAAVIPALQQSHHYSFVVRVVLAERPPFCFLGVFAFCGFVWQSFIYLWGIKTLYRKTTNKTI